MHIDRVDQILQFALLVSSHEEDYSERELGPIHLLKYVYLADLEYAKYNNGNTFTEAPWRFHRFGPWSQEVNARIEPALLAIGALKKSLPGDYGDKDEWFRWRATSDTRFSQIAESLPSIVTATLRKHIHRFGKNTPELLNFVYSTTPMRRAAPEEHLDFSSVRIEIPTRTEKAVVSPQLTKKQTIKLKKKMEELRLSAAEKLTDRKAKQRLVPPLMKPRYDEVYSEGIEWLDILAGPQPKQGDQDVTFSPSIWKSSARESPDVSD